MIEAAITNVDANLSVIRFLSSIVLARSFSSRAIARRINPITAPLFQISQVCAGP
jgi:hypothetical protein